MHVKYLYVQLLYGSIIITIITYTRIYSTVHQVQFLFYGTSSFNQDISGW